MKNSEIVDIRKKLKIPKSWPAGFSLKPEGKKILKTLVDKNLSTEEIAKILNKTIASIHCIYSRTKIKIPRQAVNDENGKPKTKKISRLEEIAKLEAKLKSQERSWPESEILEVSQEAWQRPGARRGYTSRWDYKGLGYRSGIILQDFQKFSEEGCHFNVLNGGLVSAVYIRKELRRRLKGVKPYLKERVIDHFLGESAKELASVIPKIKKPVSIWADKNKPEFVRLYIMTSPVYDGPNSERFESTYGEEIARRLQALRSDDMRLYKEGGDRLQVKGVNQIDWAINPRKHRLPSEYYSAAAEREIKDKVGQSDQPFPDLWVVGTEASAIHKTDGEKDRPYITLPASCRLEATTVAENQEGLAIVESINSERLVRFWNFKDLIHRERMFITGIKEGAIDLHRKIVDIIKNSGATTVGLLADELGIDRQIIEKEIKFLEEPKMLSRKTWPGLYYDPKSQKYDFHLDWLQERLRYSLPKEYIEDMFLLFGCLHAGYTTTDYQHFVEKYPEIILRFKIKTLVGLGDFIAGLKYDLMHRGEIINANITDQEKFAAELVGTIIIRVFKILFEEALAKFHDCKPNEKELETIIEESLLNFIYIIGNHDDWQLRQGTTPLEFFRSCLIKLLSREIRNLITNNHLPEFNINGLLEKKLIQLSDFKPVYELPSGLIFGARHPGMARADTTSLRSQKALDALSTQIVAIANFHVATVVHKWRPDLGQCVAAQAATQVIYTPFEGGKLKKLDFGPIFLRILSHDKRIYMTESAYFNKPILQQPIPKWTDVDQLKKSLNLLTI